MGSSRFSIEHALKKGWINAAALKAPPAPTPVAPSAPAAARLAELLREERENRRTPSGRKRPIDREGEAQSSVIAQFDLEFPRYAQRLYHVANGGKRTRYERHLLVKQGVRRGVPDLVLPLARQGYHGLYIEMKAPEPHDSDVSEAQEDWVKFLRSEGYCAEVARGDMEAMDIIRRYLHSEAPA